MRGDFPKTVPYGLCHCGCGEKTKIALKSNTRDGYIKGEPRKWIPGHATRFGKDNPRPNSGRFGRDSYTWKGGQTN